MEKPPKTKLQFQAETPPEKNLKISHGELDYFMAKAQIRSNRSLNQKLDYGFNKFLEAYYSQLAPIIQDNQTEFTRTRGQGGTLQRLRTYQAKIESQIQSPIVPKVIPGVWEGSSVDVISENSIREQYVQQRRQQLDNIIKLLTQVRLSQELKYDLERIFKSSFSPEYMTNTLNDVNWKPTAGTQSEKINAFYTAKLTQIKEAIVLNTAQLKEISDSLEVDS